MTSLLLGNAAKDIEPQGNTVPVYMSMPADLLTPVMAYLRLSNGASDEKRSFLCESVQTGEKIGRYSFIGCGEWRATTSSKRGGGGRADWLSRQTHTRPSGLDLASMWKETRLWPSKRSSTNSNMFPSLRCQSSLVRNAAIPMRQPLTDTICLADNRRCYGVRRL